MAKIYQICYCLSFLIVVSLAKPNRFSLLSSKADDSCVGRCGVNDPTKPCQCNAACSNFNDCCTDFLPVCNTCQGRCDDPYDRTQPCQCNTQCVDFGNCCPDYNDLCGGNSTGAITNQELADLSNQLHAADVNGATGVVFNIQGHTTSGNTADLAPAPLFTTVPSEVFQKPTFQALLNLYDNYVLDVAVPEVVTAEEQAEDDAFLDAIMATSVMQTAHQFLAGKGLASPDANTFKEYLRTIWFGLYERATGSRGSSGIEHVMLGELKNGISGLHNWVRYYREEAAGHMNYLGYINFIDMGNSQVIEMPMKWNTTYKAISSVAVSSSPELELALYTVCFLARPNALCPVQGNGVAYHIQTYDLVYNGVTYVGSAYSTV